MCPPDYEKMAEGVQIPDEWLGPVSRELQAEMEAGGPKMDNWVPPPPTRPEREFLPETHVKYQGIAAARGYDQTTKRLERPRYTHEAMIDLIIADPTIKQYELAQKFGYSAGWVNRVIGSDAFQAALAKRRDDISDPFLLASIEERFRGLAMQSIDVLVEKLEKTQNADIALKSLDVASKALGFGARSVGGDKIQNNFVVQLPSKAENSTDWASKHSGGKLIEQ